MKLRFIIGIVLFLGILSSSLFSVTEGFQALVIQFGEIITEKTLEPGLHLKIPFIQKVVYIDKRILDLSSDPREVIAADQKRLIVNYYAKYIINDPVKFYKSVKSRFNFETRLRPIIESNMREQIGFVPLNNLLTVERNTVMSNITENSDKQASDFGVKVVDVRIKRTDLPEENSDAIFRRMQTEREKEAKEIRAKGFEEAQKISAYANKERQLILSEAYKKSEIKRGEGDAIAIEVFNKVISVDEEFFKFYRTLEAYKKSFKKDNTRIILDVNDNEFLSLIKGINK
jgi:membrane protease subunit HflC